MVAESEGFPTMLQVEVLMEAPDQASMSSINVVAGALNQKGQVPNKKE
jgi:hypothetical protein